MITTQKLLIALGLIALSVQVGIFLYNYYTRQKARRNDPLIKYNLKSRSEAWQRLGNPDISEQERKDLERIVFHD
jgi:hypothetical protein